MKICKDGRIWGQNNREAGTHLGIPKDKRTGYDGKGYNKGNKNPNFGRHPSEDSLKKMRIATRRDKNPNWKGGITDIQAKIRYSIEHRLWREAVLARDNWTCQKCGNKTRQLIAHHIKAFADYPELRFAIDNGSSRCYKCHRDEHNIKRGE